jgi:hypothetical protein
MYIDFKDDKPETSLTLKKTNNKYGEGVFSIKKDLFLSMNGFEPWRCMADSDFMGRLYKNNKKFTYTKEISFYRRIHNDSLTQNPETGYASRLRAEYYNISKNKKNFGPLPKLVTSEFEPVTVSTIPVENNVSSEVFIPKIDNQKREILDKILTKNKKPIQIKHTIDYNKINKILNQKNTYNPNSSKEKPKIEKKNPVDRNKLIEMKKGSSREAINKNLPGKPNRRKDVQNIFSKKNRN